MPFKHNDFLCYATLLLILVFSSDLLASEKNFDNHHTAIGTHGMAIVSDGELFFASHMPLANSMHAHQIIFSFVINPKNLELLKKLLESKELITLMPEPFDLVALISGRLLSFKGDIFVGHFERNGQVLLKGVEVRIKKMFLSEPFSSGENGHYYMLPTHKNNGLLVHRIGAAPSFDQIIQVKFLAEKPEKKVLITLNNDTPFSLQEDKLYPKSQFEVQLEKVLYLELQDFK